MRSVGACDTELALRRVAGAGSAPRPQSEIDWGGEPGELSPQSSAGLPANPRHSATTAAGVAQGEDGGMSWLWC